MAKLPSFPVEGGCACGAVRYQLKAAPTCIYTCHCTDCQTLTTSAFTLSAAVRQESLEITSGDMTVWIRTADSGNRVPQHVCARCGVRIFSTPSDGRPIRTLRLGTLDDTSWIRPAAAIWMKSAQPWVRMPDDVLIYEDGPDDFHPIAERWREMMGLR